MTVSVAVDAAKVQDGIATLTRRRRTQADQAHAWEDPKWFVNDYLGRPTFTKQDDIIESVRDNRRTAVKGANSSGKDYQSGNIVNWWEFVHDDGIAIIYGPTMRQVRDIIWREARQAFTHSNYYLPGYMYPKAAKYFISERRYAEGFSASPDEETGSGIQGFHSPNTLLIVTEAHAVGTAEIDALVRLNPARVLLTGNTLVQSGEFYAAFFDKLWLYNDITISAFETPNIIEQSNVVPGMITQQEIDETAAEYGVDSPMYLARVLAEFPDNLEDAVVSRRALVAARDRGNEAEEATDDDILPRASLACDVARFGDDDTVVYRRQGRHNYCAWRTHGRDLMHIAGRLRGLAEKDSDVNTIIVDDTGLGGGVTDALRQDPIRGGAVRVIAFRGGSRAVRRQRYTNLVTEAWMEAARQFVPDSATGDPATITIDDNPRLIGQLASRLYRVQSDARLALEAKKDYKKRTRQSPDDADAFVMNYSPLATRSWGIA
jgi:hypothetical protein